MSLESFPSINKKEVIVPPEHARDLLFSDLANIIAHAEDTDLVYGIIKGRINTSPTTYIEESFDSTKTAVEDVIRHIISEKMPDGVGVLSLNREIFVADALEKEKDVDNRTGKSGGYKVIV